MECRLSEKHPQSPKPPVVDAASVPRVLRERGWAVVDAKGFAALAGALPTAAWNATWNDLPVDTWLKDGGRYRFRRHSCFVVDGDSVAQTPHRAHWQSVDYNALHGGIERWFQPMGSAVADDAAFAGLLRGLGRVFSGVGALPAPGPPGRWFVEAHQFRIDAGPSGGGGIGRPTPEGAHRDGVDFVVVVLVGRGNIKGGETRVFDAEGNGGVRFTLDEPWSALLLDDARVIHESTPIQPAAEQGCWRDTLVLTFRRGGFQGP